MPLPPNPDHLVRTQHRRRRYTLLVWTLALALIAAALALAIHLRWLPPAFDIGHWAFGIASAIALTTWFARSRTLDENHVARDLDAEWQLKARIEAAAELAGDSSALATAQRADAAQRLAGRRLPRAVAWHAGQLALILALLFIITESVVFTIRIFDKPPPPPPPPEDISASIDWRSPESEIKATSIEEVALAATASTRTGFRSITLEVSVNGEPRLSLPLDAETLKALAKPGTHELKLPLYLDETTAAEFDMVSYYLRADRKTREPAPVVTSPLQFIQIRPAREEVQISKGLPGQAKMNQLLALIGSLKAAQLALLKQNFLLAHAPIAKTEKAWIDANTTVAADQKTLATKTAEVRDFAIEVEAPTIVVDNLAQVIPLMETASAQIAETQNEPATRPQGRALALITEIEKIIQKIISLSSSAGGPPPPKNPDPFKDDQRYKLPPRESTPAGQLEQLAKEQTEQADKTDPSPSSGDQNAKPSPSDQAELARKAEELAKNQKLSEAARKAAEQAARDAAAAAAQLKQGDVSAARAPAQAAAQTLRDAAAAQDKAGRDAARAALEAARRALNEAAREPDAAARAEKLDAVARQLHEAAREQQESGSAEAARQLEAAARAAAKAAEAARKGTDSGPQPGDQPGNNAGTQPGDVSPSDQPGDRPAPQPGSQPGDQAGTRPGDRAGGDQPGDQPGSRPGDKPGSQVTPDPDGDRETTVRLPGAGTEPGEGSGKEPGKEPGAGAGSQPDPGGQPNGSDPKGQGKTPGQGPGQAPGDQAGTQPGTGPGQGPGSKPGSGPGSAPRLSAADNAAQAAATAQVALSDRTEAAGRAGRQLQRGSGEGSIPVTEPGGEGPGSGPGKGPGSGPGEGSAPGGTRTATELRTNELILGAQLAHAVVNTPESGLYANTIINSLRRTKDFHNVVMTPEIRAAVDHLRILLAAAVSADQRDETIRRFNPEDLDPAYREAIEAYFERLSREATRK
jgi:chemotaxis protein histidine kinase CheA